MKPRIYADFHNLDGKNRLRLTCKGTLDDLQKLSLELREGLAVTFRTDDVDDEGNLDDLLLDGIVQFNHEEGCWVGAVDWSQLRHASDDAEVGDGQTNGTVGLGEEPGLTRKS
jgi:hypothetical protein